MNIKSIIINNPKKTIMVKRVFFMVAMVIAIEAISLWLKVEKPLWVGFLVGFSSYFISALVFPEVDSVESMMSRIGARDVFEIIKYITLFSIIFSLFGQQDQPDDPAIMDLQNLINIVSIPAIFLYTLVIVLKKVSDNNYISIMDYFERFVLAVAVYSLTMWAAGQYGSDVKNWALSNLDHVIVAGGLICFIWLCLSIYYFAAGLISQPYHNSGTNEPDPTLSVLRSTQRDNKYAAVHETGHALVYAALGCLPGKIELAINDGSGKDMSVGHISSINSSHLLNEKSLL